MERYHIRFRKNTISLIYPILICTKGLPSFSILRRNPSETTPRQTTPRRTLSYCSFHIDAPKLRLLVPQDMGGVDLILSRMLAVVFPFVVSARCRDT